MVGTLKLKRGQGQHKHKRGGGGDRGVFLPVKVADPSAPSALANPHDGNIEITLNNGMKITVTGDFDPDVLVRLVRGISL